MVEADTGEDANLGRRCTSSGRHAASRGKHDRKSPMKLKSVAALFLFLPAIAMAGYDEAAAAYRRGDYAAAFKELELLAVRGDARSQYLAGMMCASGKGVPQSHEASVRWFRKAADQGYAMAQTDLGMDYLLGRGVAKDEAE
ncbi:MAG TPA: tetratricopeptide repeat protein, partial [Moraxellaceae bacterium]|nr:tetratricopeptide repeat protein [Moraxellaceae bacterium]